MALVTPFKSDGSIDDSGLENVVNHVIEGGVEYLVVLGTTGESATMTKEEKTHIKNTVKEIANNRVPLVLGIGGNNTAEVGTTMKEWGIDGYSAILSVSPYYNKPTQEGIYRHYKALNEVTPLPIILYNVPGRTSSNMLSDTTLRIARDCSKVIAIKEASGDLEQSMRIIQNKPEGFYVVSGDDALTLPFVASGGDGVISVVGNAFPKEFSNMVRAALASNMNEARALHYQLFEIIHHLFTEGNPGGIKSALKARGICEDNLRLPLWPVSDTTADKLKSLVEKIS